MRTALCAQRPQNGTHMFTLQEQPHKPQAVCKSKSLIYILKLKGLLGKFQAPLKAEEWEPASNHKHKGESLIALADGLLLCHTSLNCHCSWKHTVHHDRDPAGCLQEPQQTLVALAGFDRGTELCVSTAEVHGASVPSPAAAKNRCLQQG